MSIVYSLKSLPVKLGECKLEVDKNKDLRMFYILKKKKRRESKIGLRDREIF